MTEAYGESRLLVNLNRQDAKIAKDTMD